MDGVAESVSLEVGKVLQGQVLLLTGATGFLGKVLLEKVLRSTGISKVYLLVRTRKGAEPQARVEELLNQKLFDKLRKEKPEAMKRVVAVAGDIGEQDLGISEQDKDQLKREVSLVIHSAATVRFDEPLTVAANLNVRATLQLMRLAQEMANIKGMVHISTAYAHCVLSRKKIEEKFYKPPIDPQLLLQLTSTLEKEEMEKITPNLVGEWPNTYVFTKAVAEEIIRSEAQSLPVSIIRPAIVVACYEEPEAGWIDSVFGPTGVMAGVGAGIIRTVPCASNMPAEIVPVDLVANAILATAAHTIKKGSGGEIDVFNMVTNPKNQITWGEFLLKSLAAGKKMPPSQAIYYFVCWIVSSPLLFSILKILLHILPGILMDIALILVAKKPRMVKAYRRVHKLLGVISYFTTHSWEFEGRRTEALSTAVKAAKDGGDYLMDMADVHWDSFLINSVRGVRLHIMNDPLHTVPSSRTKMHRLYVLHRCLQAAFIGLLVWLTSKAYGVLVTS